MPRTPESSFEGGRNMEAQAELELRQRVIKELEKREDERFAKRSARTTEKILAETSEERDKDSVEAAALYNLREQLAGKEIPMGAEYDARTGKTLSEKWDKVEGKTIPELIKEIEGYLTGDREEIRRAQETGKQPSPRLTKGLRIQERKREILRELTGM